MKLPKAIEILKADLLRPVSVDKLDFQDAEQLGIEALKCIERAREEAAYVMGWPLPGETNGGVIQK